MVLTFSLVGAIFSSLVWLVYSIKFILGSLGGMSFFDAGLLNVLLYTLFVCLPEFVIWMIFAFISQHFSSKTLSRQMYKLFSQMKKNQEYSDLLARIMLETGENIRNSFMMNHFELLIADMNELLSEIAQRENLVTKEQVADLWLKVQSGGKWAFGKIFIEKYNKTADFKSKLLEDALSDNILAGTIMEFCARYQSLLVLLEKYDKEKTFLNVVETGVLGKAFSVMASVSDSIRRSRDIKTVDKEETVEQKIDEARGLYPLKKDLPRIKNEQRDAFSLALERSFSPEVEREEVKQERIVEHKEPVFTDKSDEDKTVSGEFLDSQKTLDNLKKEWKDIETKQESDEDSLVYPFGGWIDVDKYQK